jgi:hypothetical protein
MTRDLTTIDFHGATLIVRKGADPSTTMVAMKPVVEGMGLDWKSQHVKLVGHPVLSKGMVEITIPSAGGPQAMTALPLTRLNFWLATLHPNKIPSLETRERVIVYQTEAAEALFAHFFGRVFAQRRENPVGMIKALVRDVTIIKKQNAELTAEVDRLRAEADIRADIVIGFKPALQVLVEAGVPSRGRRALAQRFSSRLRRFSISHGYPIRESRETRRYLFHVDAIAAWMAEEGMALLVKHMAGLDGLIAQNRPDARGQGVLRLVRPQQPA